MEPHLHSRLLSYGDYRLQEVGEVLLHFLVADGAVGAVWQEASISAEIG